MATKKFLRTMMDATPLDIIGNPYDIVFSKHKWRKTGTPGTVNFPLSKIYVDTSLSNDRFLEVLLHEITEVIKNRFTIKELNHQGVCEVEFGINDVFRRNPEFRKCYSTYIVDKGGCQYEPEDFKSEGDADGTYEQATVATVLKDLTKTKKKRPRKNRKK